MVISRIEQNVSAHASPNRRLDNRGASSTHATATTFRPLHTGGHVARPSVSAVCVKPSQRSRPLHSSG